MRLFILPAAILLALCLYLPLPKAAEWLAAALRALYGRAVSHCTKKSAKRPEDAALIACCICIFLITALISALHPIACAVLAAPLFMVWAALPACAQTKETLDSGAYERDIPTYENIVRSTCAALAGPFVSGMTAPMLLCAVGIPLHAGCAIAWVYLFLRSAHPRQRAPRLFVLLVRRASAAVTRAMLHLCSCAAGKNPLRARGDTPRTLLMNILGIAGDESDTHAPMSGDISQAAFVCILSSFVLGIMVSAVLAVFVR